jgi:hypothetical protein
MLLVDVPESECVRRDYFHPDLCHVHPVLYVSHTTAEDRNAHVRASDLLAYCECRVRGESPPIPPSVPSVRVCVLVPALVRATVERYGGACCVRPTATACRRPFGYGK